MRLDDGAGREDLPDRPGRRARATARVCSGVASVRMAYSSPRIDDLHRGGFSLTARTRSGARSPCAPAAAGGTGRRSSIWRVRSAASSSRARRSRVLALQLAHARRSASRDVAAAARPPCSRASRTPALGLERAATKDRRAPRRGGGRGARAPRNAAAQARALSDTELALERAEHLLRDDRRFPCRVACAAGRGSVNRHATLRCPAGTSPPAELVEQLERSSRSPRAPRACTSLDVAPPSRSSGTSSARSNSTARRRRAALGT